MKERSAVELFRVCTADCTSRGRDNRAWGEFVLRFQPLLRSSVARVAAAAGPAGLARGRRRPGPGRLLPPARARIRGVSWRQRRRGGELPETGLRERGGGPAPWTLDPEAGWAHPPRSTSTPSGRTLAELVADGGSSPEERCLHRELRGLLLDGCRLLYQGPRAGAQPRHLRARRSRRLDQPRDRRGVRLRAQDRQHRLGRSPAAQEAQAPRSGGAGTMTALAAVEIGVFTAERCLEHRVPRGFPGTSGAAAPHRRSPARPGPRGRRRRARRRGLARRRAVGSRRRVRRAFPSRGRAGRRPARLGRQPAVAGNLGGGDRRRWRRRSPRATGRWPAAAAPRSPRSGRPATTPSARWRWGSASSTTPRSRPSGCAGCTARRKVAIVDFDVHHGNGTQHIFESRGDVLYVSAHQYPFYPGTGAAGERGTGEGLGATLNVPLAAGSDDAVYRRAFEDVDRAGDRGLRGRTRW